MLSIQELRATLPDEYKNLSDEEVTKLRNTLDGLANVMFDMWLKKKNKDAINRTNKKNTR